MKAAIEGGDRLQNEGAPAINKLKDGLRDNFLTILLGSVVISFLAGYFISRQQEAQKREQWAENLFLHAKDWLSSEATKAECGALGMRLVTIDELDAHREQSPELIGSEAVDDVGEAGEMF